MGISRKEAVDVAHKVVDYKSTSYVAAARELALFLLAEEREREAGNADGYRQLADALTACQARGTELIGQVRDLKAHVQKITQLVEHFALPEDSPLKRAVDEAMTYVRAMQ